MEFLTISNLFLIKAYSKATLAGRSTVILTGQPLLKIQNKIPWSIHGVEPGWTWLLYNALEINLKNKKGIIAHWAASSFVIGFSCVVLPTRRMFGRRNSKGIE
jgi:hypothetical protein